jgi:uncharacterized hydrophobic protein (TIGR00271 family)
MPLPILRWLRQRFNLSHDMADAPDIMADVEAGVKFQGTNLWVLIFAILIASVGLNVNSTAVIIGAMLISPLMGPVVAIGFGAATVTMDLVQRGLKNLLFAVVVSLVVSALYFRLTPLTDAGSELLARTQPTIWDVLIAMFGGAAGAVGFTRREWGNTIPGVAIATALMPPLCTAGYGIATGHWVYSFGALYLFFINCVFISFATFLVARILPLPSHTFASQKQARRVQFSIWTVALLTGVPSVYLAAGFVQRTIFEHNAQQFIDEQLKLPGSYVVTTRIDADAQTINVLLAGQQLPPPRLKAARATLGNYRLSDAHLTVRQGLAQLDSADAQSMRNSLLEDIRSRNQQTMARYDAELAKLQQVLGATKSNLAGSLPTAAVLLREVQAEHPTVQQLGLSELIRPATDSLRADTTVVVALRTTAPLPAPEQQRLRKWLAVRAGSEHPIRLLLEDSVGR